MVVQEAARPPAITEPIVRIVVSAPAPTLISDLTAFRLPTVSRELREILEMLV